MIPILYDKKGIVKLGELNDILSDGYVEEERNGIFELTFDYPNDYPLADQLIEENLIEVKPNDKQGPQKFRIYDTKKMMDNIIVVYARHESFDLANDHVESVDLKNASCEYALNTLFRNSHFSQDYRGYSDIVNAQDYKIDNANILAAIAGKEGSIVDTYGTGAEILRDGKNIHVLNKRGHDNGVTIEYGKNLTGFELDVDLSNLETRCGGFAKYKPEGSQDDIIIKSDWIDSPFIDNFSHPYISVEGRRDYSDKFKDGEVPTKEKLNKLCADEFKINKRDIPAGNYQINFIPLSKCVGYEGVEDEISLCDTGTIIDPRFNVNTKAKVISYKYDFIKERYISMELGEPKTTLGDIIGSGQDGQVGPQGPQGPPGADGDMENFPNTLPNAPVLNSKVLGFASVELSWTYEDKVYYTYELYASKTKNFTPNTFDLIHNGQSSSYLFQAKPGETWHFKICAKNTHGERTRFSQELTVITTKVEDMNDYFTEIGIGRAVAQSITSEYMEAGIFKGNWIDAKNLSVTDGNGKRTFDIDSFGRVTILPSVFNLSSECETNIPTKTELTEEVKQVKTELNKSIGNVQASVNNLRDYTDGAFKDDLLTEDEKGVIKSYLNPLESNFSNVTKEYSVLYSNPLLLGEAKTNLQKAYNSFKLKYDGLINIINSLLNLSSISEDNKIALENAYNEHDTMLANYRQRASKAIDSISSQKASDTLNSAKTYTNAQIKVVNDEINLKVSKKEYDENKNVINDKFTKFEQTFDDFNFKFQNTGAINEVDDSNFGRGTQRWQLAKSDNGIPAVIEYSLNYNGGDIMCTNSAYIGDCSFDKSANWVQKIYPKNTKMTKFTLSGCYHYTNVRHGGGVAAPIASLYMEVHNKDGTIEYYNHGNLLNEGSVNVGWKTIHQTYTRSGKPIDYIRLFVYKRNTTGELRITQIDLHENGLHRKWIPGANEINNHITTIDANGVKVDSIHTSEFARIDEQFFCVYSGGEAPVNRRAFMGLVDGVPTFLLGANGINPGVNVFGGTHLGFKHYAPSKSPLDWGGSWGMFEYKLDSGTNHISRMGFNQIGNIEFIPHSASHFYKNLNVHGNNDYEISASMGIFQTYMKDWSGGITANLRGVKVHEHVIGSDNRSDIHCINKSGGRSRIHASFINMTSAHNAYDLGLDTPKVYKSDTQVQVDLGEAIESLVIARREQEKDIVTNLLATIETYEMMLELNPQVVNNEKRKNRMSKVYATLINKNEITINDVPLELVEVVKGVI